jgi:hypothetical protein
MSIKMMTAAAVAGVTLAANAHAATVIINLNPSNQNFTLFGQGAVAPGVGGFTVQQGNESFDAGTNTSTDIMTGTIANSTNASYGTGSYSLVTSYSGTGIGSGGKQITAQSDPSDVSQFFYTGFDSSVNMTLELFGTPAGTVDIPLVANGAFSGPGFSFHYTTANCSGVAVCTQNGVGLTPGSSIFGPVTISVAFDQSVTAAPEPATWALMMIGVGAVGAAMRASRRRALVPTYA